MKYYAITIFVILLFFLGIFLWSQGEKIEPEKINESLYGENEFIEDIYFISKWDTTIEGDSRVDEIKLPLVEGGDYDFVVSGSDLKGSPIHIESYSDNILQFETQGVQEIKIKGELEGWSFGRTEEFYDVESNDRGKIIEISRWGDIKLGDGGSYFLHAVNLEISANDSLDLSETKDLSQLFRMTEENNFSITGDINSWNVSNVENMHWMFGRTSFNSSLSNWDVSSVEDMRWMFAGATNFNQPLNSWNVSSVTQMDEMFWFAQSFNQPLDNWDVSSVESMSSMFRGSNFNQDIGMWDVSNVENMRRMFVSTPFNQNISCWDVEKISEEPIGFSLDSSLEDINKPNWGNSC